MLNFGIVSKVKKNALKIKETAIRLGLTESKKPEFIFSVGGDGTFLRAEREHPGIPKLLIKDSNVCHKCDKLEYDRIFMAIAGEEYRIVEHMMLETTASGKTMHAINDFSVRNKTPQHALRFMLSIDGRETPVLIGDGIVVATPFGSTGYFYSITRHSFKNGIGLAYNNVTTHPKDLVLGDDTVIKIKIIRQPADLTADNHPTVIRLSEGDTIAFRKSKRIAKIIHPKPKLFRIPFRKR